MVDVLFLVVSLFLSLCCFCPCLGFILVNSWSILGFDLCWVLSQVMVLTQCGLGLGLGILVNIFVRLLKGFRKLFPNLAGWGTAKI